VKQTSGMIFLFTDFGSEGPYLGQMEAVLRLAAPGVDVVNLVSNAPLGDPESSSYLLADLAGYLPTGCVVLAVVDPGVGGERKPMVLEADGRWFVGPDNGLLNTVALRARQRAWCAIEWRPAALSASFHGRDLFAPIAARIAKHDFQWGSRASPGPDLRQWPADLDRIVYFDCYGNAFTGRRYTANLSGTTLFVNGHALPEATTFCSVPDGQPFWYRNSIGVVEVAVNRGSARRVLGLAVGMVIRFGE
jgi:S-adenosylmethionine hydrolase